MSRLDHSIPYTPIPPAFFAQDPLFVAEALLGALLIRTLKDGSIQVGKIIETEAYRGEEDQACHAHKGRTSRTEVMYGPPGRAYIYLIYGMHHLLNVTAWPAGQPASILIRALEPMENIHGKTHGPGRLTRSLQLDRQLNQHPMQTPPLFLAEGSPVAPSDIARGPRIGVDYAGEWAQKPWRFWIRDSPFVSVSS